MKQGTITKGRAKVADFEFLRRPPVEPRFECHAKQFARDAAWGVNWSMHSAEFWRNLKFATLSFQNKKLCLAVRIEEGKLQVLIHF